MKRNHNLRKLKSKKCYSTQELADTLGTHPQTVRSWRKNGLQPIDDSSHNSLYLGSVVQAHLKKQMDSRRMKLAPNEFYCLGCHAKTTSLQTTVILQNKLVGKNKDSIRIEGKCIACGKKVNKFDAQEPNKSVTEKVINTGLSPSL